MAGFASLLVASTVRVASLNMCSDEYLLLLARPQEIASVTRLGPAGARFSTGTAACPCGAPVGDGLAQPTTSAASASRQTATRERMRIEAARGSGENGLGWADPVAEGVEVPVHISVVHIDIHFSVDSNKAWIRRYSSSHASGCSNACRSSG